jgi:hypothetical protein
LPLGSKWGRRVNVELAVYADNARSVIVMMHHPTPNVCQLPKPGWLTGNEEEILCAEEAGLEIHIVRVKDVGAIHLECIAVVL